MSTTVVVASLNGETGIALGDFSALAVLDLTTGGLVPSASKTLSELSGGVYVFSGVPLPDDSETTYVITGETPLGYRFAQPYPVVSGSPSYLFFPTSTAGLVKSDFTIIHTVDGLSQDTSSIAILDAFSSFGYVFSGWAGSTAGEHFLSISYSGTESTASWSTSAAAASVSSLGTGFYPRMLNTAERLIAKYGTTGILEKELANTETTLTGILAPADYKKAEGVGGYKVGDSLFRVAGAIGNLFPIEDATLLLGQKRWDVVGAEQTSPGGTTILTELYLRQMA